MKAKIIKVGREGPGYRELYIQGSGKAGRAEQDVYSTGHNEKSDPNEEEQEKRILPSAG